jgi:hypothetical protein
MTTTERKMGFWNRFFSGPGVILLIPCVIVVLLGFALYALSMAFVVRMASVVRGRYVVFVHSNSPVWQDYIADRILPRLPADTVILNWSDHLVSENNVQQPTRNIQYPRQYSKIWSVGNSLLDIGYSVPRKT